MLGFQFGQSVVYRLVPFLPEQSVFWCRSLRPPIERGIVHGGDESNAPVGVQDAKGLVLGGRHDPTRKRQRFPDPTDVFQET